MQKILFGMTLRVDTTPTLSYDAFMAKDSWLGAVKLRLFYFIEGYNTVPERYQKMKILVR